MNSLGFLVLSNIPDYNEEKLFEHAKWFWRLPAEVKERLYKKHFKEENPNHYRGLAPFVANDPSHKELYEIGWDYAQVSEEERGYSLHEETPWPECQGGQEFKSFMTWHFNMMHKLALKIMSHIA